VPDGSTPRNRLERGEKVALTQSRLEKPQDPANSGWIERSSVKLPHPARVDRAVSSSRTAGWTGTMEKLGKVDVRVEILLPFVGKGPTRML
jgi:hypothetical protein